MDAPGNCVLKFSQNAAEASGTASHITKRDSRDAANVFENRLNAWKI